MASGGDMAEHEQLLDRPSSGRVFDAIRRVRLADASAGGRLRLDACARYLQDIANDDSRDAGSPNPTAWVARRTVIRVEQFPQYLDMTSLATWCSGLGSRWAERRYSVLGADGSTGCIHASTLWVHIDMNTMRPIPVPVGFAEQFGAAASGRIVSARLHLSSRPPANELLYVQPWPLRFVDFDVLGHVNNSVYWAIVEEQLARLRQVRAPFTVTLEHRHAIDPGSEVTVTVSDTEGGFDLWVTATGGSGAGDVDPGSTLAAVVRATRTS